jgi:hypothetical protein
MAYCFVLKTGLHFLCDFALIAGWKLQTHGTTLRQYRPEGTGLVHFEEGRGSVPRDGYGYLAEHGAELTGKSVGVVDCEIPPSSHERHTHVTEIAERAPLCYNTAGRGSW